MCVFSGTDFNTCFNAALAAVILSMFEPGKRFAMEPETARTITTLSTASWAEARGMIKRTKRTARSLWRCPGAQNSRVEAAGRACVNNPPHRLVLVVDENEED